MRTKEETTQDETTRSASAGFEQGFADGFTDGFIDGLKDRIKEEEMNMSQEQIVVDVQPIATETLESMEVPLREGATLDFADGFMDDLYDLVSKDESTFNELMRERYSDKEDLYPIVQNLATENLTLNQESEESWRALVKLDKEISDARDEIWGLKKEISSNDWELGELERQVELRNKALLYGGSLATGITIAAILGYVKERKVHKQIVALIEETALILANEEVESRFVSFDELVSQVSIRLSEFEVRSFRRPFGIPAKELERTTSLLVGMLRTAETLGMQYVNFETANTVDVEPKE